MKKKIIIWSLIGLAALLFLLFFCDFLVNRYSSKFAFDDIDALPENKVGLLLGTAKMARSGQINLYFKYRIDAAEKLYKAGKIKKIIISGDNGHVDYNEPQDMKDELLKRGIPEKDIYLDYAGFNTYDSVYRIKAIFGQHRFTIISQGFHNRRAIYIASALGLEAVGFNAKTVKAYWGIKTVAREKLARVSLMLDLCWNRKPKFLGEQIEVES